MTTNTPASQSDAIVAVLRRLRTNLAEAPANADKCFVSLDDHRTLLTAIQEGTDNGK